jgi:hypothetical protein
VLIAVITSSTIVLHWSAMLFDVRQLSDLRSRVRIHRLPDRRAPARPRPAADRQSDPAGPVKPRPGGCTTTSPTNNPANGGHQNSPTPGVSTVYARVTPACFEAPNARLRSAASTTSAPAFCVRWQTICASVNGLPRQKTCLRYGSARTQRRVDLCECSCWWPCGRRGRRIGCSSLTRRAGSARCRSALRLRCFRSQPLTCHALRTPPQLYAHGVGPAGNNRLSPAFTPPAPTLPTANRLDD